MARATQSNTPVLRRILAVVLGMLLGPITLLGAASTADAARPAAPSSGLTRSHAGFCREVQRLLVPTALEITNIIEPDFEAFKLSKPKAEPLTTHQFLAPPRADGLRQLSCKTKSADHLRAVHGPLTAAAPPSPSQPALHCRNVHRAMVLALWREASAAQRAAATHPPHRIMLEADLAYLTGSSWVQSAASADTDDDGRLYLRAARLFAAWEDWRWKMLPETLRGNHYCHLIAPESLHALIFDQ